MPQALSPFSVNPTAVVYCEANFGAIDGKTANGLVRHSERYEILVGDRQRAGRASMPARCWATSPNGIPVCRDLDDAIARRRRRSRLLHLRDGAVERHALARRAPRSCSTPSSAGMDIVNGLHEFLNDDPEFAAAAAAHGVDDPRRAPTPRQEGPPHVQRPHRRRSPARGSRCSAPTAPSASAPPPRSSPGRSTTAASRPSWSAPARPA